MSDTIPPSWGDQPSTERAFAPYAFDAFADYADGERAIVERVGLRLTATDVVIMRPDGGEVFWHLVDLRALRDQADRDGLVLTPGHGSTARLVISDADLSKRIRLAAPKLDLRAPVDNWGKIIAWGMGAVVSVMLIIFVLVPTMANQLATYLPPEGEKALGDATYDQIRTALGRTGLPIEICEGPEGLDALDAMLARLNADETLPYPVEVAVLDHDMQNAFALPGGRVVLFRGLVEAADDADEVAAVLAHELGHVANRDPARHALRSAGSIGVLGLLFGDFAGGTMVLVLTNQLINATYSQSAETGADVYAHELLTEAEVDPAALGRFFERLMEEYGDAEGLAAHLSTHPQFAARIAAAEAAGANLASARPVLSDEQWSDLESICGDDDESEDASMTDNEDWDDWGDWDPEQDWPKDDMLEDEFAEDEGWIEPDTPATLDRPAGRLGGANE